VCERGLPGIRWPVPEDVSRYVGGPMPYSPWWLWLGLLLLAFVIVWCAGAFVWTLPAHRLRRLPVVRSMHAALLRRRFTSRIRSVDKQYRAGELSAAQACGQMSRTLRSFLHQATGARAQYMHVSDISASPLAETAPLFSDLHDGQFNTTSDVNVSRVGSAAEEMIRTWT
jgi:hypothetical protein